MSVLPQIVKVEHAGDFTLNVTFADGSHGAWRPNVKNWRGPMSEPLRTTEGFKKAFVEAGAITWPNGFDASPEAVWEELKKAGSLVLPNYAAE